MKQKKRTIIISFFLLILSFSLVNCSKKVSEKQSGTIIFLVGTVQLNESEAKVGNIVKVNDVISTSKKSVAIIQFSSVAQIAVQSKTKVRIMNLVKQENGKFAINIFQEFGKSFNKIIKGKSDYSMKSPTITASVRGTSFAVTVSKKNTTGVDLLHGSMEVHTGEGVEEAGNAILNNLQSILGNNRGLSKITALSSSKRSILEKLDSIQILPHKNISEDYLNKNPIKLSKEVLDIITDSKIKNEVIKSGSKQVQIIKSLTLADIKKKYGKLSVIVTKNGEKYTGAFTQSKASMIIITTKGEIKIPTSMIDKVMPY